MLNQSGIKKQSYGSVTQILCNPDMQYSIGCVVAQALGVTVGSKKIVKAGTPLAGTLNSTTPYIAPTGAGAANTAVGVLLHDVDVTAGNANGTLLVFGFVNLNRLETDTKALVTADVITKLNAKVTFLTM